jgi:hypothetical protein
MRRRRGAKVKDRTEVRTRNRMRMRTILYRRIVARPIGLAILMRARAGMRVGAMTRTSEDPVVTVVTDGKAEEFTKA